MALAINTATPVNQPLPQTPAPVPRTAPPNTGIPPQVTARATSGASTGSTTQQAASLSRLLSQYKFDQANGAPTNTLTSLGRQVLAAAKAAGQHVTLPRAPAVVGAVAAAPAATAGGQTGTVNVTA